RTPPSKVKTSSAELVFFILLFYICTDSFFSLFIFSRFRLLKLSNIFNTNTIASMINMLSGTPVIRLCLSPAGFNGV
ncbi:hypothetical protein, partial [Bacillus halotolerans]|uniref:hypothetical protein n=1 Tax=Bacillus halotolerans TaxID=260554 RepID=UPI003D2584D0